MKWRIFLVEDEAIIALELRDRLEALGYDVCGHASRGRQALERISEAEPDLVLLDVNLPGEMSGLDVAERLLAESDIRVVFLTADPGLVPESLPAHGCLGKPFDEHLLEGTIEGALERG